MNKLSNLEAEYLSNITPHLKDGANKQVIINIFRASSKKIYDQGKVQGRSGYQGDVTWSDDQLQGPTG